MYDYVNVANAISIHAPREGGDFFPYSISS